MVSKKLEQRVERRKQEAIDEQFIEKSDIIARELVDLRKDNSYCIYDYTFRYGKLELNASTHGHKFSGIVNYGCNISHKEEEVFSATVPNGITNFNRSQIDISSYIPGEWKDDFEKLHQRALRRIERRSKNFEKDTKNSKEDNLRKKFGL